MVKYFSKINKIRIFVLSLVFVGFIIMYIGIFFKEFVLLFSLFMIFGFLFIGFSMVVYFWIGMFLIKVVCVICLVCVKEIKVLGRVDMCMYCRELLILDKGLEGKEFDEFYNKKKMFK